MKIKITERFKKLIKHMLEINKGILVSIIYYTGSPN